jgi:hypothetical protein
MPCKTPPPAAPGAPISPPKKRAKQRHQPTNEMKKALRDWYNDDSFFGNGPQGAKTLQDAGWWWEKKYGWFLRSSTVSDYLSSSKYEFLDDPTNHWKKNQARSRSEKWDILEEALFEWEQRFENANGACTGDILREKATEFWNKLPCYTGQDCPKWTNGWLEGFKTRHNIKKRNRHGEAGSADQSAAVQKQMQEIQEEVSQYEARDVFNTDETGLFWKKSPRVSLATSKAPGLKEEKARITAVLTCNADGTEKLPIWFIGKHKTPRCFTAAGIKDMRTIGAHWRYNSKAWMAHKIMMEFLRDFDNYMATRGRKVLLLMDNFSAHELAADTMEEAKALHFTKVIWLPANSTSIHQPLDQGIIQCWKTHTKAQFVTFMVKNFRTLRRRFLGHISLWDGSLRLLSSATGFENWSPGLWQWISRTRISSRRH